MAATGTATMRRRRLPAEQVPWLVIGMALFRDRPITEVVNKLDLALPSPVSPTVAPSAVVQARNRLGESPMEWLFARSAAHWAHRSADRDRWRGLALYGMDGSTQKVPDTDENRAHFGLASGGDRGQFHRDGTDRHWLIRAKKNTQGRHVEQLGPGDELVELDVSRSARKKDPSLPETWLVRIIHYQRKGFRPQRLITSLTDPERYPADELIARYHERWEIELGYDEVKTEMLESIPLRSKSVERVRQEIWGLLIAYNLIRLEIERVADEADLPPTRISFVAVYRMICDEWLWCAIAAPGAIPRHLRNLRKQIRLFVLPPRRRQRSYPRAVKVKMSGYPKKRRPGADASAGQPKGSK